MKKVLLCTLSMCIIMLSAFTAEAAKGIERIAVETDSGMISITGVSDADTKNAVVQVVRVPQEGETDYISADPSSIIDNMIYCVQKNTENGKYEFTFNIDDASQEQNGKYCVRVADDTGEIYEKDFYYYNREYIDAVRLSINELIGNTQKDETKIQEINDIIKAEKNAVISAYEPFDAVFDNNVSAVFSELMSYEEKTDTNAEFRQKVKKNSIITLLGYLNGEECFAMLENYAEDLGDTQARVDYSKLEENYRKRAAVRLADQNGVFLNGKDFWKTFDTAVVTAQLECVNGVDAVKEVLQKYPNYFNLNNVDNEGYKAVMYAAVNNTLNTIEDICTALRTKAENPIRPSGGAGGGTTGSYIASSNVPDVQKDKKEYNLKHSFADLEDYSWAKESIDYLYKRGIINGCSDDTFAPADNVTRAQMCKMLCHVFSLHSDTLNSDFSDVKNGDWFYKYICTLSELGVVSGTEKGIFEPNSNVTRQDMAVLAYRIIKFKGFEVENGSIDSFKDGKEVSDYAIEAISVLSAENILKGDDEGNINPKLNATRAEAAKFIYEICLKYGGTL